MDKLRELEEYLHYQVDNNWSISSFEKYRSRFHYEYGVYEIYYPERNMRQTKKLVSHYQYLKDKSVWGEKEEYFTDESPLFKAMNTGWLICNGKYRCIIKFLHN